MAAVAAKFQALPRELASLRLPPSPVVGEKDHKEILSDDISIASGSVYDVEYPVNHLEQARPYPLPPASRQNQVLPVDLKTPDAHVTRDPRLIRLTGVHPFNVEAPLTDLFDEGFLTTKDLHYVRNHGPVPKVEDVEVMDWEFTIEGMVEQPIRMTLKELVTHYEQQTYPITLVCAGNRRKEQNVVRKTKGFSWGAAGLSTALWTGVPLSDLLRLAIPKRGARYVYFEGADKLPNGYYGTSVKLNWALDPNRGILVAHKMNGEVLHPDHGKPLRIVIPGQIGGRSVKWLKRIVIGAEPSDNWYHIYDNRVLPTMIDPEASANLPETWKDERYAIYDLNTNSATVYPAHDERLQLQDESGSYHVRGYAYAGGGKRVSRMEVTLDKGKSWTLANIQYHEDEYRLAHEYDTLYGGKVDLSQREACFCWCFWSLDIPLSQLRDADDIMVRAMDDSMMVQPRDMYWSVLGMMNNPWYRIVIHKEGNQLRFEHPTQPALLPGGWMERVKKSGGDLANGYWGETASGQVETTITQEPAKEVSMVNAETRRTISGLEFEKHGGDKEPWFVVNGQVYDGTKFLGDHPGGAASIIGAAGQDITEEFLAIHSENAKAMMPDYHIGTLDAQALDILATADEAQSGTSSPRPVFLQPKTWSRAILNTKKSLSADTKVFSFKLDHAEQIVGLPTGQHLMLRLRDPATREVLIRAYTPVSENSDKGLLDLVVKIYRDSEERKGGRMTQALDSLPLGHFVEMKGPVGKFEYLGQGRCSIGGKERRVKRFVMVCAGSGITPIFQVLRAVMRATDDSTHCIVLNGNRSEEDILCRTEVDALAAMDQQKCRLIYTLTKPGPGWAGYKGRMDAALFDSEVGRPPEDRDSLVLICGPEPMEKTVADAFVGMGWSMDDLLFF